MSVAWRVIAAAVLAAFLGCGGERTHEDVVKDTVAVVNLEADALAGIHDEATARAAIDRLKALNRKTAELKAEMAKLGPPTPEMTEKIASHRDEMRQAFGRLQKEQARIQHELGANVLREIDMAMSRPN